MKTIYEIVRIKQVVKESQIENDFVRSPEDGAKIAYDFIGEDDREVLLVMCLNTKNKVVAVHRCHIGSLNSSVVHPREVFKAPIMHQIIKNNSASIIIAHQHPSGDPQMSQEDLNVSKRIKSCGELLGIPLLDSLIIGEKTSVQLNFISLK